VIHSITETTRRAEGDLLSDNTLAGPPSAGPILDRVFMISDQNIVHKLRDNIPSTVGRFDIGTVIVAISSFFCFDITESTMGADDGDLRFVLSASKIRTD
jgi:hypothetical protein